MSGSIRIGHSRAMARSALAAASLLAALPISGGTPAAPQESSELRRAIAPSTLPAEGAVEFPNADRVAVTFRRAPAIAIPPDPWEQYAAFLSAAQWGDAAAAGVVGTLLMRCGSIRGLPFSAERSDAFRPREKQIPSRNSSLNTFCAQRADEEIATALSWLRKGAEGGDVEAMKRLSGLYLPGSGEQLEALNSIWKNGSIGALHKLAGAYRFRGARPDADPQDATRALASTWLYVQLNESAFRQHAADSDFIEALRKELAKRLEEAAPGVQADATALARTMLTQNPRCCVVP